MTEDVDAPSTSDDTSSIGTAWQTAPVTVTLTPSDSGAGVAATYYTTDGSLPTTSSAQGTTINLSADGVYVIRYFSVDRVGNVEPVRTAFDIIRIDKTDPAQPTITLSESSPYAYVSGSEIFVNTGQSGSYDIEATSSDATAGIERMSFPGGVDDVTSPYGTSYGLGDLSGMQTVTAHDYAGNTASDTFTVTPDTAAPTGGSVSYADGYDADGQVPVSGRCRHRSARGHRRRHGRPRAAHLHACRQRLRRLLRGLVDGDEPGHARLRSLCPVSLPRL